MRTLERGEDAGPDIRVDGLVLFECLILELRSEGAYGQTVLDKATVVFTLMIWQMRFVCGTDMVVEEK